MCDHSAKSYNFFLKNVRASRYRVRRGKNFHLLVSNCRPTLLVLARGIQNYVSSLEGSDSIKSKMEGKTSLDKGYTGTRYEHRDMKNITKESLLG